MYSAIDVACAVVNYSQNMGYPVSNLKLQKVLYFIDGFYMQKNNTPFFKENIEAWPYGPVVVEVYNMFQNYGSNFIPKTSSYFEFDNHKLYDKEYSDNIFKKDDYEFITKIVERLKCYSAFQLVDITHRQTPWKEAIKKGNRTIISKVSIQNYFLGSGN